MRYISTRDSNNVVSLEKAIQKGLADDGGLYVPENIPQLANQENLNVTNYAEFASSILMPYFEQSDLASSLLLMCKRAFDFDTPFSHVGKNTYMLSLFYGPTLSFKDYGARFLSQCLTEMAVTTNILVATSGDTGSAVASAFSGNPRINVIVLFPKDKISERQQAQMTCWGQNVKALAVDGVFDDCQRMVKGIFADSEIVASHNISTANSINIARLLPQIVYYAYSSTQFYQRHHQPMGYIVPSGNLGNVTAAFFASKMGFPIREIVIANNANRVMSDYLSTAHYQPRETIKTLANAMDVGAPSNFERLNWLMPEFNDFKASVSAYSVTDEQIASTIKETYINKKSFICPHTATAVFVRKQLSDKPWCIVATASPAKFESVIEPLVNVNVAVPEALAALLDKATSVKTIAPTVAALKAQIVGS